MLWPAADPTRVAVRHEVGPPSEFFAFHLSWPTSGPHGPTAVVVFAAPETLTPGLQAAGNIAAVMVCNTWLGATVGAKLVDRAHTSSHSP